MNDKKLVLEEDIVTMLDQFMAKGGGHMNVDVNDIQNYPIKQIDRKSVV